MLLNLVEENDLKSKVKMSHASFADSLGEDPCWMLWDGNCSGTGER